MSDTNVSAVSRIDSLHQFNGGTEEVWNGLNHPIPEGVFVVTTDTGIVKRGAPGGKLLFSELPVWFDANLLPKFIELLAGKADINHSHSINDIIGLAIQLQNILDAIQLRATIHSPNFTGIPTTPTAPLHDKSLQICNMAALDAALSYLVGNAPGALDQLNELANAIGNDPNFATTMLNNLKLKAPLASPIFTGTPKAPTPPVTDTSDRIATMAALSAAIKMATIGYQTVAVTAGGMTPLTRTGPTMSHPASDNCRVYSLMFNNSVSEYAYFMIPFTDNWDTTAPLKICLFLSAKSGSGTTSWQIAARSHTNGTAYSANGTATSLVSPTLTVNTTQTTDFINLTVTNPNPNVPTICYVRRLVGGLASKAMLLGCSIGYKVKNGVDIF